MFKPVFTITKRSSSIDWGRFFHVHTKIGEDFFYVHTKISATESARVRIEEYLKRGFAEVLQDSKFIKR